MRDKEVATIPTRARYTHIVLSEWNRRMGVLTITLKHVEANIILKETRVTHRLAEVETMLARNFCVVVGRTHSYIGRRSRKEHIDILYLYILVK